VIVKDISPVATHHYLVLSHRHIQSAKLLQPLDQDRSLRMIYINYQYKYLFNLSVFILVNSMVAAAKQVLSNNGCDLNDTRYCLKFIYNI